MQTPGDSSMGCPIAKSSWLMIHPVVVASGKRLFKDGGDLKRLKLVDSKTTSTGVSILTYQPDKK